MQCPSCAFENIPGQASCGRCGTRLDLRTADIDVTPPRARKGAKAVRSLVPRRRLYQVRDEVSDVVRRTVGHLEQDSYIPVPERGLAVRLIVPGWPQAYQGRPGHAWVFAGVYLALGLVGMACWGSALGAMALGLMFSTHLASVVDALMSQGRVQFPAMMATTFVVSIALGLLLYGPAGWVLSHVAAIRVFNRAEGLFWRDDRVVVNEWAFGPAGPKPGRVVLFNPTQPGRIELGTAPHMRIFQAENELVDRVLAGPGDSVTWDRKADALTVNGRPSALRPLRPERLPDRLEIDVPAGCHLILPTTSEALNAGTPSQDWATAGCVRRDAIIAGAYLRLPLTRLWWLR